MKRVSTHTWPVSRTDALAQQAMAAARVEFPPVSAAPRTIVAVETDYGLGGEFLYAAAVVLSCPELTELGRAFAVKRLRFPYLPGLFYFREGPAITEALAALPIDADIILVAGHGMAHPKHCGLASQIGLDFNRPAVGCARKLLVGQHESVSPTKGSCQPVLLDGLEVGYAYRSKDNVKPIFISPGHLCDLTFAKDFVVQCLRGFRMPEPLRVAHLLAARHRQQQEQNGVNLLPTRWGRSGSADNQAEPDRK